MLKSHGFAINLSSTDRCYCGAVDDTKHFLLSCFIWQEERSDLIQKVKQVLPSFSQKSIRDQCEILTFGINLNSPRPDPRNKVIMFAVQKFITKTNRFSKHYDWKKKYSLNFLSYSYLTPLYCSLSTLHSFIFIHKSLPFPWTLHSISGWH